LSTNTIYSPQYTGPDGEYGAPPAAPAAPAPPAADAAPAELVAGAVPPETEYVLLVALLSAEEGSNRCFSFCRLASDFARGRNTSKIVGLRLGEAMPCTVD